MDRLTVNFATQYDTRGEIEDQEQANGVIRHGAEVSRTQRVQELLSSGVLFEEGATDGPLTTEALHGATVPQVQENLDSGKWSADDVERLEADREGGPRVGVTRHLDKLRSSAEEPQEQVE